MNGKKLKDHVAQKGSYEFSSGWWKFCVKRQLERMAIIG